MESLAVQNHSHIPKSAINCLGAMEVFGCSNLQEKCFPVRLSNEWELLTTPKTNKKRK
jgi:hypothetical protein